MRLLNALLLVIFLTVTVYAQNIPAEKVEPKTETKTEAKTDAKTETRTEAKTENKDNTLPVKDDNAIQKIPDGYGNLTWGTYLTDARTKIAGVLTYTDDKTVILSKDKELEFKYGFFYKEPSVEKVTEEQVTEKKAVDEKVPEKKEEAKAETDKQPVTTPEKDEGRLFYVSMNFPYLDKNQVYEKIRKKYGKHTGENLKDNQGAIAWDSENTIVIMWVDRYEKKPYCRRIIYISKQISKELNEYTYTMFNKTEIELIKKMNP